MNLDVIIEYLRLFLVERLSILHEVELPVENGVSDEARCTFY